MSTAALFDVVPVPNARVTAARRERSRGRAQLRAVGSERRSAVTERIGAGRAVGAVRAEAPTAPGGRPVEPSVHALPGPVAPAALALLADAGRELDRALGAASPADRYAAAHLGALRAAAAVLATRARPSTRGRRPSAWDLLAKVAPEYAEWAAFFAAGSSIRQQAQAGLTRMLTTRLVDDMVRQSEQFIELVRRSLEQPTS